MVRCIASSEVGRPEPSTTFPFRSTVMICSSLSQPLFTPLGVVSSLSPSLTLTLPSVAATNPFRCSIRQISTISCCSCCSLDISG